MPVRPDVIEVVERAYDLEASDRDWLKALARSARPLVDRGLGVIAYFYEARAGSPVRVPYATGVGVTRGLLAAGVGFVRATPPEIFERTFRARSGCATASEVSGLGAALEANPAYRQLLHPHGMHDYLATNVLTDPAGRGCIIGAPLPAVGATPGAVRRLWDRLAAHLAAGLRLRAELRGAAGPLEGAEAILTPGGRVEHAADAAKSRDARERLREAVRRVDRARGRLRRSDPGEALELWRGLVSGRWSLVDHFEGGGRRFVVARRNDPAVPDPRALGLRERQVVWYASLGHANKLIGYELGLSTSCVATHLSRAMAKLGVATRADLIALVRAVASGAPAPGEGCG